MHYFSQLSSVGIPVTISILSAKFPTVTISLNNHFTQKLITLTIKLIIIVITKSDNENLQVFVDYLLRQNNTYNINHFLQHILIVKAAPSVSLEVGI